MTNDDKDLKPMTEKKMDEVEELKEFIIGQYLNEFNQHDALRLAKSLVEAGYTCTTPQQPSEPLKELDEKAILMVLDQCCPVSMDKMAKEMIAQILWNKFGQPSEKKALSLNNIYEIIKRCDKNFNPEEDDEGDRHYIATLSEEFCDFMAKAIHSALPAQREVRYPEKLDHDHSCEFDCKGCISNGWNQAINKMRKLNGDKT